MSEPAAPESDSKRRRVDASASQQTATDAALHGLHLHLAPPRQPPGAGAPASYARASGAYTQREEHLQRQEAAGELQFAYSFGEIAFCAVTAAEQVKGFGTRLMNRTKGAARDHDGLTHFLTYADNNAVGYFLKQGFTRGITLPREVWGGYIKDYDGGTLMECVLHARLPYADLAGMLRQQKGALDAAMRALSGGHVVRDAPRRAARALPREGAHPQLREVPVPLDVGGVPGVREAGWTPHNAPRPKYRLLLEGGSAPVPPSPSNLNALMAAALAQLDAHADAWPFHRPVDRAEAVDYYDIIKDPVDLSLVRARLEARSYYATLDAFLADLRRMFANCRYYNAAATPYYQAANRLEAALDAYMGEHLVYEGE
ncbi:histone acetyltransferase [Raphidocelis subcapitata]|uniref:histone acetyltransferase n=1 Tax=Raphidocelis subcapitata TaxID=307507 RepID=A0A2V0PH37_9CHLO|nr:histone acetyltransferase [Raphidocelis subcapitata]|eukprot:GBF97233.1 histone acetyltransferase [Raphidocelis subcapitata]